MEPRFCWQNFQHRWIYPFAWLLHFVYRSLLRLFANFSVEKQLAKCRTDAAKKVFDCFLCQCYLWNFYKRSQKVWIYAYPPSKLVIAIPRHDSIMINNLRSNEHPQRPLNEWISNACFLLPHNTSNFFKNHHFSVPIVPYFSARTAPSPQLPSQIQRTRGFTRRLSH